MTTFLNDHRMKIVVLTGWVVYIYTFMEWLFFATIPSFLSSMSLWQKADVFLIVGFLLAVPFLLLAALLAALSWRVGAAVPAFLLSALALILLDNFTYTLLKIGIVTSVGAWRVAYGAAFLLLLVVLWKRIHDRFDSVPVRFNARPAYALLALVALSAAAFLADMRDFHLPEGSTSSSAASDLPNIILIGVDGVDATHMSAYGYQRDTTPNIARLAPQALVFQNAFSNAGKTGGSLTSILTGKPSTETRVIFPPDILLGQDAYQHLPGILKQQGYHTVQITMQYYGDAYERNILDGFDVVNGRVEGNTAFLGKFAGIGGGGSAYFLGQILYRITQRLAHIFFLETMKNPYAAVTNPRYAQHDDERMAEMFQYLDSSRSPIFLHVHLMDTHGPEFYVPHQYFAAPEEPNQNWNLDYYDDAIRDSDRYIGDLFDHLEKTGMRKRTLVILYSDHGLNWNTLERVPLMFWFPDQKRTGDVPLNAQLLDISPTILDYLGIRQPSWMSGVSLLDDTRPAARPIFSAVVSERLLRVTDDRTTWVIDETKIRPPFYQLGALNLVVCNQWYSMDLDAFKLRYGSVRGSTTSCGQQEVPSPAQATHLLVQFLQQEKYDVSSIPTQMPAQRVEP